MRHLPTTLAAVERVVRRELPGEFALHLSQMAPGVCVFYRWGEIPRREFVSEMMFEGLCDGRPEILVSDICTWAKQFPFEPPELS